MSEKLQKVLARVGLGSRRYMEEVIAAGRVSVNGQVAQVGERIEPTDELRIDGRKVTFEIEDEIRRRVLIYYKPEGEICSRNDPENRPTVFDQLPAIPGDRWVMVGRLDINSTGLLLFTNDGELANRLMHPSNEVEREYAVRVMGEVTPQLKKNMTTGVVLDDGPAKFESFSEIGGEGINRWFQVVVKEGRNREVRRIFESQGLKVSRLLRTRYGTVILPRELRTGRWVELDKNDIDNLTKAVELKPRQGTGLFGMAKRRNERMQDKPLAARRGGYLRQQRRDEGEAQPEQRRDSRQGGHDQSRGENRFNNRTPRTEGFENRFNNRAPRAEGQENRFNNRSPRPEGQENRVNHRGPRTEGQENRFNNRGPRPEGQDNRYNNRTPRAEGQEPRGNRFENKGEVNGNSVDYQPRNENKFAQRKPFGTNKGFKKF